MQSYQDLIDDVKDIIKHELGIVDLDGRILACSNKKKIGKNLPDNITNAVLKCDKKSLLIENIYYHRLMTASKTEIFTYVRSNTKSAKKLLDLFSVSVLNYIQYYLPRFDTATFLKRVIFGHMTEHEIYNKAGELRLDIKAKRVVFKITVPDTNDNSCISIIENIFPNKKHNIIFKIDIDNYVLVRTLKKREKSLSDLAHMIKDTVNAELMVDTKVSIGTKVDTISDLKKSYQNAITADIVGNIFEGKEKVADYNKLGIGRLIYKLPEESCRIFLEEVFPKDSYEAIDEDVIKTAESLLACNFNISKTSEILFVHRNSVIYRIQKIYKLTGLDVRNFNDAVIFKLAMLVSKYLAYIDKHKTK